MSDEQHEERACKLCGHLTIKSLSGDAAVGEKRGRFTVFVCEGCWYLYEKFGTGHPTIEAEIRDQVLAS